MTEERGTALLTLCRRHSVPKTQTVAEGQERGASTTGYSMICTSITSRRKMARNLRAGEQQVGLIGMLSPTWRTRKE